MTRPEHITDAARRCSDIIRQHIADGYGGQWAAIRLSDGGSDGVLYASKSAAVAHQLHEQQCCYVYIPWDDMSPRHAQNYLDANRKLYDGGFRIPDPDTDVSPLIPQRMESHR